MIVQPKSLASFGLGILVSQMGSANVFFQSEFATISLSTANAIPTRDLVGGREINLATAESLLSLMNSSNMHSQVALLGEAAITTCLRAGEDLSLIKTDITVCYLQMAPKLS